MIANYELAKSLVDGRAARRREDPAGMNKGGTVSPLGAGIKVHMVPASHTSIGRHGGDEARNGPARGCSTAARRSAT